MSPNGARHIFKLKPRSKKTPSLSPSPISSPSTPRTLPSLLISNSTPLSSQLPPPPLDHESTKERSVALSDGTSKDDPDQNKKVYKDSPLNQNSSSLTSITRHTPSLVKQELAKLPDITPIEQLSSLPEIQCVYICIYLCLYKNVLVNQSRFLMFLFFYLFRNKLYISRYNFTLQNG